MGVKLLSHACFEGLRDELLHSQVHCGEDRQPQRRMYLLFQLLPVSLGTNLTAEKAGLDPASKQKLVSVG